MSREQAQRDIKETVWRTYKNVMLLGKDGEWKTVEKKVFDPDAVYKK